MQEYHKIDSVFTRDHEQKKKPLIVGHFSCPEFEYLQHNAWIFTEKVDGTNVRVMCSPCAKDGPTAITFGGRTEAAQLPAKLVTNLQEIFFAEQMPWQIGATFPNGVCFYGEGYGHGIQGGLQYSPTQSIVIFDILVTSDDGRKWWLGRDNVEEVCVALGLQFVPVVGVGTLSDMVYMCERGFESRWGRFMAEGIVARPTRELMARNGKRIITKLKYKDFPHAVA
jgi:hypothetical protein